MHKYIKMKTPASPNRESVMPRMSQAVDPSYLANLATTLNTKFVWVIRDFSEDLEDESGDPITENRYFETKLSDFSKSSHRKFKQINDAI